MGYSVKMILDPWSGWWKLFFFTPKEIYSLSSILSCKSWGRPANPKKHIDIVYTFFYCCTMKIDCSLHGILFEWDSNKSETNLRKHGIAFENACEVFKA